MNNIDINEWMLNEGIDPFTIIKRKNINVFLKDVLEKHLIDQLEKILEPTNSNNALTISHLKELHPELSAKEATDLWAFCRNQTIYHKECYGDGSIIYPLWQKKNKKIVAK